MRRPIAGGLGMALVAGGVAVVAGSCVAPEPPPIDDNEGPVARLQAPQLVSVGVPARLDASASDDVDGDVLTFSFSFGDGTPLAIDDDGVFEHAFALPGTVAVAVEVVDAHGVSAQAGLSVVVVKGAVEPCSCETPCLDPGICAVDGCVVLGASIDEAPASPDGVVVCD